MTKRRLPPSDPIECPKCGSDKLITGTRNAICKACDHHFRIEDPQ